jgi:hypothetical protein
MAGVADEQVWCDLCGLELHTPESRRRGRGPKCDRARRASAPKYPRARPAAGAIRPRTHGDEDDVLIAARDLEVTATMPNQPPAPPVHSQPSGPPQWTVEKCESCSADIIWAVTVNVRVMPVNAEPVAGANVALEYRPGMKPLARVLTVAQQFGRTNLRLAHHASCPEGPKWRRRR